MIPEQLKAELESIKEELQKYRFTPYFPVKRRNRNLTPEALSARTGCGLAAAHLILTVFPRESAWMKVGECHLFNNTGIDNFISQADGWAAVFIRQGFVPVLSDTGGSVLFVPVSSESLEPVVMMATDESRESEAITGIGSIYRGNLHGLLRKQAENADYQMFGHVRKWSAYPGRKALADEAWTLECEARAGIPPAFECGPPVAAVPFTHRAALQHAAKMVTAICRGVERFEKAFGRLPTVTSCCKGSDTQTTTEAAEDLINLLMGREPTNHPHTTAFLKKPPLAAMRNGLLAGGIFEDSCGLGICDPWGNPYHVLLDYDYDGRLPHPEHPHGETAVLHGIVAVWSAGPDGDPETWQDNICSWKLRG